MVIAVISAIYHCLSSKHLKKYFSNSKENICFEQNLRLHRQWRMQKFVKAGQGGFVERVRGGLQAENTITKSGFGHGPKTFASLYSKLE